MSEDAGERHTGDRYLLPNELRVAAVRRHPIRLARPVLIFFGLLILSAWVGERVPPDNGVARLLGYLVFASLAYLLWELLGWWQDRLIITDRRILLVTGLLTRRVGMMPLTKVTDMTYERPLLGRLLGYGTFIMESAGQDQALHRIPHLPRPDALYRSISQEIFGRRPFEAPSQHFLGPDDDTGPVPVPDFAVPEVTVTDVDASGEPPREE